MADIDLRRIHGLGLEGARAAADRLAADLARRFELRGQWQGDVLRFERPGLDGALKLGEKDLHLTVTLGFLLKAMRAEIERAVGEELDRRFPGAGGVPPASSGAPTARKASGRPKKGG